MAEPKNFKLIITSLLVFSIIALLFYIPSIISSIFSLLKLSTNSSILTSFDLGFYLLFPGLAVAFIILHSIRINFTVKTLNSKESSRKPIIIANIILAVIWTIISLFMIFIAYIFSNGFPFLGSGSPGRALALVIVVLILWAIRMAYYITTIVYLSKKRN